MTETLIVYGEPIRFNPELYPQQTHGGMGLTPHAYYRNQIWQNEIAVNVKTEAEYMTDRQRIAALESQVEKMQAVIDAASKITGQIEKQITLDLHRRSKGVINLLLDVEYVVSFCDSVQALEAK